MAVCKVEEGEGNAEELTITDDWTTELDATCEATGLDAACEATLKACALWIAAEEATGMDAACEATLKAGAL